MDEFDPLTRAVLDFDIPALRRLVAEGADVNARDEHGDPFLFEALFSVSWYDEATKADHARYAVIEALIDLGADPCRLGLDGGSILIGPIFSCDAAMVELLLVRGVDPNHGCSETFETVYSLASFDYQYEAWDKAGHSAPAIPDHIDPRDEDRFLAFLDLDAKTRGSPRPEVLTVLRRYGALSNREMARKLGGDGSEWIVWRDGRWQLNPDGG